MLLRFLAVSRVRQNCRWDNRRENGIILMLGYFITSYLFVLYEKKTIYSGDIFILGGYVFLLFTYPYLSYCLFGNILDTPYAYVYYICAGITSKLFLILITCWLLEHLKFTFHVPNKQYFLVIQDEEDSNGLYERIPYIIDIVFTDEFGF